VVSEKQIVQFLRLLLLAISIAVVGRFLANKAIEIFPAHELLIERIGAGIIAVPLCFLVLIPLLRLLNIR
jgi:hypothetical protein